VLAAEHFLGFSRVYLILERVKGLAEIRRDVFSALRPLEQDADVVDLLGEAVAELDVFGKPPLPLQRFLGFGLVVPEIGRGDFLF
jgi:hypothetical protein